MTDNNQQTRFKRKGTLIHKKLMEYLPALIVTNLSTFLLLSVDGLVVGNLIGADALSAVNIFYPATIFIGAGTSILSNGASSALSTRMGRNDIDGIRSLKKTIRNVVIVGTLVISFVQIPLVYLLINLYRLSPEMNRLTWLYAIGILISTPFGVISTVGTYMLQILGKSKPLMDSSLDFLFALYWRGFVVIIRLSLRPVLTGRPLSDPHHRHRTRSWEPTPSSRT